MNITVLKGKLHRATVTQAELDYEGSIGIDQELIDAAGMRPYEKVMVANLSNGKRWETYVISEKAGSKRIVVNGAAAHLASKGDLVIIFAFAQIDSSESLRPKVILMGPGNAVLKSYEG